MEKFEIHHTPGPHYAVVYDDSICIQPTPVYGSTDLLNGRECQEYIANGNLYAAADSLLSALIKAVEHEDRKAQGLLGIRNTHSQGDPLQAIPAAYYPGWYAEAKAAIAAAGVTVKTVEDDHA